MYLFPYYMDILGKTWATELKALFIYFIYTFFPSI